MDILQTLKGLLPYAEETTLNYYILQATNNFLNMTNLTAVPANASTVIVDMVLEAINLVGYEGLLNTNLSGVSYGINIDYSPKILAQISNFRVWAW